jgi:hypothetical protein
MVRRPHISSPIDEHYKRAIERELASFEKREREFMARERRERAKYLGLVLSGLDEELAN